MHSATEIQQTDFNQHQKDSEAKEWYSFECKEAGTLS